MDDRFEFEFERAGKADAAAPKPRRSWKHIHKKVVCRYWLTNSCSKGDACEFIHEMCADKMPECRKGEMCADPSCILKHSAKSEVPLCPMYEAGFCSFGHSCQWRHEPRDTPPPAVASRFLIQDPCAAALEKRSRGNPNWRRAPCPYFTHDRWCPYFELCAFHHDTPAK